MRLRCCQLLHSTHFIHKLQCAKVQDCSPVLAFDLIRECQRYIVATSNFLHSTVLVVKAFNIRKHGCHLTARAEVAHNLLDGMNHLAAIFQLHKPLLSRVHSRSTTMGSCKLPKNRKQTRWVAEEVSKALYVYLQAGVSSKWYTICLLF